MKVFTKIALVAALFTVSYTAKAQTVSAGCTGTVGIRNLSDDVWRISYYDNEIVVQPATPADPIVTLGFTNANPSIGRGVILEAPSGGPASPFCGYKFQTNPDSWNAPCAPGTNQVTYEAIPSTNGCFNQGRIIIE